VSPTGVRLRDGGFSFIELLAYMAIAALLILAAVPQFSNYRDRAYDHEVMADFDNFMLDNEAYAVDAGAYATSMDGVGSLGLRPTRAAYRTGTTTNAMLYCGFRGGTDYAILAVSKSNRAFLVTASRGIEPVARTMMNGSRLDICPAVATYLGYTDPAMSLLDARLWLHDSNAASTSTTYDANQWSMKLR